MTSETTRLRALLERATPRPWHNGGLNGDVAGTVVEDDAGGNIALLSRRSSEGPASEDHEAWANGDIIVAAVNALPALLDRAEAAEARVAALEAQGLALAEDARAAYAQRREMGSEAQRLREIIAGRTTPPTGAEIAALRSRVDALETALRDLAASRRDDQWCGDCGARWKAEHPDGCYVGAALRTLDAGVSRGE